MKSLLIEQQFEVLTNRELLLESAKAWAYGYAQITEGVAVISDFHKNVSYIYSGKFGQFFNLPNYFVNDNSAFEDVIFNRIFKEDLLKRHVFELYFFNFLKNVLPEKKCEYQASCLIRLLNKNNKVLQIIHNMRYLNCLSNGSVWCGVCTYAPSTQIHEKSEGCIVNISTGETVRKEQYMECSSKLLSKRQTEILALLAKGFGSKQIADKLNISLHTVNRHRQDILSILRVTNTVAAVGIGLRMRLI
ncbi:helix-turn-helix transcriptional regulator [uncultured Akkermansia sp.]|uniref:response regulator transcription factor n=1 Tax=uncultured Akkermansia sp. TaxID=512294 RepID=UPI002610E2D1|nr:helix-turn-helix transcriptional regulator [uncultured Akkermansia sp.]